MTNEVRCGDPAAIAGYVYDECDASEREAMAAHLATCARCADDIATLRATRRQLAQWTPPEARLGFRIAADDAVAAPGGASVDEALAAPAPTSKQWWQRPAVPAWAQAAAAVMLFALGATVAALMNLEVRYDPAGVTVRTGWQQRAAAPATPAPPVDMAALEGRIREEIKRVRAEDEESGKGVVGAPAGPAAQTASATAARASSDEMLRRVRDLVDASEERQQRELAFRLSQLLRDVDAQRRADMARIERTVGPIEGVTTEEIQQQRRMLNYLMTVSQTK